MVAAGMGPDIINNSTEEEKKKLLEAAKLALELGTSVNAVTWGGRTALHGAVVTGFTEMVQYLAEKGADLEAKDIYGQNGVEHRDGGP